MTVSPVELASLMCSRLCHDLLSPVGALNNGLELLADETDPAMRERCMELLADSARTSANKLKFFRLAFGAAGGFGEQVDVREARQAIEALVAEGKGKTLAWLVEAETLPKAAVKTLLNLALIGADSLVRGGTLSIGAEENGGQVEIVVQGEGPRVLLDAEIRRTLTEGEGDTAVSARTAASFMVHSIVAERGGSVQVSLPADGIVILGATLNAS
ncbi:histidine phosphotransferase family protein [Sphingomonas sp.]|jgi:histidine phosphotransferase ChpT|uniref:histidine phosphotransferase family protein n=1 Tax=Sphingomonas sp. TaxID=28214 RepID=UPI002EDA08B0